MGTYNALLGIPVLWNLLCLLYNERKSIQTCRFGIGLQFCLPFLFANYGGRWLFQQLKTCIKIFSFTMPALICIWQPC
jgi:hypothetical protein